MRKRKKKGKKGGKKQKRGLKGILPETTQNFSKFWKRNRNEIDVKKKNQILSTHREKEEKLEKKYSKT